ncbi:virginiamycin A acetyltransferase [Sulfitobacter undariae]|uniref:Virginiamycin A acetyltransferase n=1 Tax=Sulfitobacter undariae TaxID=1563671 RepID=A0A7W6E8D5_9RHOB|nr:CatB-related O-acetyltransferase [Sulfitobacter undariae]MBB3993134.1 virginiamycin A acetyltransferase [Sulfitobacter undariae]
MTDSSSRFPSPTELHPIQLPDGSSHGGTVFLAAAISHPQFEVGAYTYASAFDPPADWAARLAPYLFDFSPEKLQIGKFCQIADGVQFITSSANHRYDGISSFPFAVFGGGAREGRASMPAAGPDTSIGHDVWIGQGALILPGANIGNGVIVGAGAVVAGDVPAYSIVAGNPATTLRRRFTTGQIAILERICWWDWPIEHILRHEASICGGDVDALAAATPSKDSGAADKAP